MDYIITRLLFSACLYLVSGWSLASSECSQVEGSLIDHVLELCASYGSIDSREVYSALRENIEDVRMEYYVCKKNEGHTSPNKTDINIFIKSKYVLSQVDFYLKLREERKSHLELWAVEERIVSNAVADDCDQFISEVKEDE